MSKPACPTCRESMSSVERGFGGVWSCVYCEGTWLPASQLKALTLSAGISPTPPEGVGQSLEVGSASELVACPSCEGVELQPVSLGSAHVYRCAQCGSAFFKKGVLAASAPQAFSSSQEAPVVGALLGAIGTVAMLGDPLLLIAALAYQARAKSAL